MHLEKLTWKNGPFCVFRFYVVLSSPSKMDERDELEFPFSVFVH